MALVGGGRMRPMHPANHVRANAAVNEAFLPVQCAGEDRGGEPWELSALGS